MFPLYKSLQKSLQKPFQKPFQKPLKNQSKNHSGTSSNHHSKDTKWGRMLIVKTKGGRTPTIKLVVIFPTPKLLVLGRVRAAVIGSPHHHRHGHAQRHHQHHHQQHCRNSAPTAHLQASSSAPTAHPPYPPTPHSCKSKLLKTTAEWTCKNFNRKKNLGAET